MEDSTQKFGTARAYKMDKKVASAESRRLSREDWVEGAILFLSTHSVDALRLDVLAEQLGVTKGSFYWHFASREQLLDSVLETWRQRMTRDIEAWIRNKVGTPAGRLKRLLRISIATRPDVPGGPLEITLRDWARRDARVHAILGEVDQERLNILRSLYRDHGLPEAEAEAFALLYMTYVIGGRSMLFDGTPAQMEQRWQIGEQFLVPKPTLN
jgi:AcrR family transcriptional regulator